MSDAFTKKYLRPSWQDLHRGIYADRERPVGKPKHKRKRARPFRVLFQSRWRYRKSQCRWSLIHTARTREEAERWIAKARRSGWTSVFKIEEPDAARQRRSHASH